MAEELPGPAPAVRAKRVWTARRLGALLAAGLVLVALIGPLVAPYDPEAIDAQKVLAGPEISHPLGFDSTGRDVLSRLLYAFRVSLGVALGSVLIALVIGGALGILAGHYKGKVDTLTMRPVDMMLAFPAMLLAITLIAIVGPGTLVVTLAIAGIYVPILARVVRSSTLTVSSSLYVDAARCRGVSDRKIIFGHVIPNAMGPGVAQAAILAGFAIQIEAALSFLGLGAQPPTPSLGVMLADGRDFLQQAPLLEIIPGVAIAVTVLAFLLLGDAMRGHADPRGIAK